MMQAAQDSDLHRWGEQISLAATRAAEITQQLLSFSHRSEGKQRAVLDLNQIVHEAGQLARRTLRANVNFEIIAAPKAIPVKIEFSRATQTLLNLCVNAQDAMPGGGRLTITNALVKLPPEIAKRHDASAAGEFARCSVSDTGCGIPSNLLPRIFEAFFTTKGQTGTGLGLSIVQRIMQEAGGFVEVDSTPGQGTAFHLYFPVARENLTVKLRPAEHALPCGKGRVLVVDDLDLLRDFAKSFLETTGLTVLVAASGREALQLLEKENGAVDILFTDYSMPGMNGADLIEQVAVRWPEIHPVLASGYLEDPVVKRLEDLKAKVLAKPYEMQEAATMLVGLLPKRG
jgi:CheY-like chemotaxis protein